MQLTKNLSEHAIQVSTQLKEPKWLLDYRLRNVELLNVLQTEKSSYTDMGKLDGLMQNALGKTGKVKIEVKGKGYSKLSDSAVQEKVKAALGKEVPGSRIEAFNNAFFTEGFFVDADGSAEVRIESFGNAMVKAIFNATGEKTEINEAILGGPESMFYNNNVIVA